MNLGKMHHKQICVYSGSVLGGMKRRSTSCWNISATFDEWRSAPGEKGEAITMHKPEGETNTALNSFPLITTRANTASFGQVLGDNSESASERFVVLLPHHCVTGWCQAQTDLCSGAAFWLEPFWNCSCHRCGYDDTWKIGTSLTMWCHLAYSPYWVPFFSTAKCFVVSLARTFVFASE